MTYNKTIVDNSDYSDHGHWVICQGNQAIDKSHCVRGSLLDFKIKNVSQVIAKFCISSHNVNVYGYDSVHGKQWTFLHNAYFMLYMYCMHILSLH